MALTQNQSQAVLLVAFVWAERCATKSLNSVRQDVLRYVAEIVSIDAADEDAVAKLVEGQFQIRGLVGEGRTVQR